MATKHRHEPETLGTLQEGDFRRISGIGPGIEQRLKAAGIKTFDQLASLSPEEIVVTLNGLVGITRERIIQQDWGGQAGKFALEVKKAEPQEEVEDISERQHYRSFMIELLLDEERNVRRTRAVHVQGGEKESWAGWSPVRLTNWMAIQAGLPETNKEEQAAPGGYSEKMTTHPQQLEGNLKISEAEVTNVETSHPDRVFWLGEPFILRITLDLSQVTSPPDETLSYRAIAKAKKLVTGQEITLGETRGECYQGQEITLSFPVTGLEEGAYRLETAVGVFPAGYLYPEQLGLQALSEGGLILVQAEGYDLGK
jgi:hypothetical protein